MIGINALHGDAPSILFPTSLLASHRTLLKKTPVRYGNAATETPTVPYTA
jgi:hypothetical protein